MKILVAEDQADLARLLQIAIERQGFTVDIANNGQVAVELGMQHPYDVMILD
ncbi:MAG: response regulator, partial [Limosilactobacillus sp.]|nr:response regulator [Limosilactobacillus sp.]